MARASQSHPPWGTFALSTRQAALLNLYRYAPLGRKQLRGAVLGSLQREDHPQQYDIAVGGVRSRCHVGDNASELKLLLNGSRKDRTQLRQILNHLMPGGTFVDIGANVGLYSLRAARAVGPSGRVLAIEPNREMAGRLRFNLICNGLNNVVVEEVAVGTSAGTATLTFDPHRQGAGTLAAALPGGSQPVTITPLADLIAKRRLTRIDALKIDIEGYEDRALLPLFESAPATLWPRMILMEVSWRSRWNDDCVAKLIQYGYLEIWRGRDDIAFVQQSTS